MRSSIARQETGTGGITGGHSARAALDALAAAGRAVQSAAGTGSDALLAGALIRLAEATVAAEELAAAKIAVDVVAQAAYAAGAAGYRRHLRSV